MFLLTILANIIPFIPLVALGLGIYGSVLVTRAAHTEPKTRNMLGIAMLVASGGAMLALLLVQLLALRLGTPKNADFSYALNYVTPYLGLALGIYGAVLVAKAAETKPKSRSSVGIAVLVVSVGAELALLLFQMLTLYSNYLR